MLDNPAMQLGFFFVVATTIFTIMMWIIAAFAGIKIEKVGILLSGYFDLFKVEINNITLILGWLPIGSFIGMAGMLDLGEDETPPQPYDFRQKSFFTKFLILFTSPILLAIIGISLLGLFSSINISNLLNAYIKTSCFIWSVSEGQPIWDSLLASPIVLMGFTFFFLGISNLLTNLGSLLSAKIEDRNWLTVFFSFSSLFFAIGIFRLTIAYFSILNIAYFLITAILTGVIAMVFCIFLAKILPNN